MSIRIDENAFRDAYRGLSKDQKERFFPGQEEQARKGIESLDWLLESACGYDRLFDLYLTIAARIQLGFETERIGITIKQRFSDLVPDNRLTAVIACIERINENYAYIDMINSPEMKAKERTFDLQNKERFRENQKRLADAEKMPGFGVRIDNPVYTHFAFGSYRYLNLLYTADNAPLTWHRLGSYGHDDCNDLLDKYDLLLPDGKVFLSIFINMYSRKESEHCPRGLVGKGLKTVPEMAENNEKQTSDDRDTSAEDDEYAAFLQNYAKDDAHPRTETASTHESNTVPETSKEDTTNEQSEPDFCSAENEPEPEEVLNESNTPILLSNFPIILEKSTVFKRNCQLYVRCSFLSISDKPIRAMQMDLMCFNIWHEEITSVTGFQYLDMRVGRDQSFGTDTLIALPDPATRAVEIVIGRIAYTDVTLLQKSDTDNTTVPDLILLEKSLGSRELIDEYKSKTYQNAQYVPVRFGAFWRCTCGALNREDELTCHKCADTAEILFENLDQKTLQASINKKKQIQKEKEEQERIEREEARNKAEEEENIRRIKEASEVQAHAEKRKMRWKRLVIICLIIIALAFAVYLIGWQLIPARKYSLADKLLQAGDREGAYSAFLDLGDYRDSYNRAIRIKYEDKCEDEYKDAVLALNNGDFDSAIKIFNRMPNFKDSQEQAKEAKYQKGLILLSKEFYYEAEIVFDELGDYKDSPTYYEEAKYQNTIQNRYPEGLSGLARLEAMKLYGEAIDQFDRGQYRSAVDCFRELNNYKDSAAWCKAAMYAYVLENMNRNDDTTFEYLTELRACNYEDCQTLYEELFA